MCVGDVCMCVGDVCVCVCGVQYQFVSKAEKQISLCKFSFVHHMVIISIAYMVFVISIRLRLLTEVCSLKSAIKLMSPHVDILQ